MSEFSKELVLAVDVGTSSVKSALYDLQGKRVPDTFYAIPIKNYIDGPKHEIEPIELRDAFFGCINKQLNSEYKERITGIGISAFWHTLMGLDSNFNPITKVMTWADRRGEYEYGRFRNKVSKEEYHQHSGCFFHSCFWPSKLEVIRKDDKDIFDSAKFWVSSPDWLYYLLTGKKITTHSMASATGLYNRSNCSWSQEILSILELKSDLFLSINDQLSQLNSPHIKDFSKTIPCYPPIGDGAAGNLGSDAIGKNTAAVNYGTSSALRFVYQLNGKVPGSYFAYKLDKRIDVIGGASNNAGNIRQWCINRFNIDEKKLDKMIADKYYNKGDYLFTNPYVFGERAPHWDDFNFAQIENLESKHTLEDIALAFIDGTFLNILDLIHAEIDEAPTKIIVSGGICRNQHYLERLASLVEPYSMYQLEDSNTSIRGAAINFLQKTGNARLIQPQNKSLVTTHGELTSHFDLIVR